ncbi:clavaldehyde dehydrogenase [Pseudoalteromonas sp. GCY]|uniref:SDR family NAD(P)-dependent oxidoreductase n=1 Tax=Pseudoalteromonas sp. GCY TaxID=2003316 RepID=UPI000BFF0633|nr:SDR family oxidoreductase [Pseudoalteromonas sp. GCY]PHI37198.1 clavaldehyde dehydrogenase [Pseudoalteromonas sp. GCY]QQQ66364.1 SDR family oxidoreductase [Pseudoalteromonas sp. GCY]
MKVLITGGQGGLAVYLSDELKRLGHEVEAPSRAQLDVSKPAEVERFVDDKSYDCVINAAGTLYSSLVADSDPNLWIRDIEVNLIGTYLISRAAIKANKAVHLVNVASTAAFNSYKDWTSYCAAKAGVVTLSKGLHKDGYKITVLCPGAIDTKLRDGLTINNPNVMSIPQGAAPILEAVTTPQHIGKLFFYRLNESRSESLD